MTFRDLSLPFAATLLLSAAAAAQTYPTGTTLSAPQQTQQATRSKLGPVPAQTLESSQPAAIHGTPQLVTKIANAERKLTSAKVQDMLGRPVGSVQSVHTSTAGTVTSAKVALTTQNDAGKFVTIPASQLAYDSHTGVVVAQMTQTEIDELPATTAPTGTTPRGY